VLISCEKCSTTYVLDDKLIPAQGAPVQCTRCGHVFTARAPSAAPSTSTQMFGSPVASNPPTNKTVMFGVPGNDPAGGGAGAANRTMMFGAGGNEAPGAAPASKTAMFGAPGSDAPAPGGPSPNKTVMFGAPGSEAATGGAPTNRTMMFGAPGADAPAAPPANKTSMFGAPAGQTSAAGGAANRTMMFGAPAAEASATPAAGSGAVPNKTMMFGAPSSDGGPQGAPSNKTMMFGAPGDAGTVPQNPGNPRATMMFGAQQGEGPAQAPPPRASSTMMFGAPGAQQPAGGNAPPVKAGSSTMMFGTPAAAPPAQQNAPAQKPGNTMMFGTRAPVDPAPAQPKTSGTMIFGAGPVISAPTPQKGVKLSESTVRMGPEDLERMMREHESITGQRAEISTPSDGSVPTEKQQLPTEKQAMPQKTQMFAMGSAPDGATPPAGNDAVSRQNKTQMFAMSDAPQLPPASTSSELSARRVRQPKPKDPSVLDTFPPGSDAPPVGADQTILSNEPMSETVDPDAPNPMRRQLATNAAEDPVADEPGPGVELPPETPELLSGNAGATQQMSPVEADPAAMLRAQVARRNRVALIIIALVLVGAALAVTWKVFGRRLMSRAPPAAAVEGCDKALSKLRFDDSASKAEAVTMLQDVTKTYPDYIEGHAALVTAVSLQLDDVQQRVRRIEQLVERDNTRIARFNKEHSPSNWETQAQNLSAQVEELIKEHKPLADQGQHLDGEARAAYKGLELAVTHVGDPSKPARLAALRAQALFHGVSGTDEALKLTTRYEQSAEGQPPDGWIDLAVPEYVANARVSEELMTQAQQKLDELHKRDSTFLRTYVLAARLALLRKDIDAATTNLDQVLSMQKNHDVALELRDWIRKMPRADEKKDAPAP
jgi:predicted Zn finger-like uncharacterized protein